MRAVEILINGIHDYNVSKYEYIHNDFKNPLWLGNMKNTLTKKKSDITLLTIPKEKVHVFSQVHEQCTEIINSTDTHGLTFKNACKALFMALDSLSVKFRKDMLWSTIKFDFINQSQLLNPQPS